MNICSEQEMELELTYLKINFLIKYECDCDGDITLNEVIGKDGDVLELLHEKVEAEIKEMIFSKLKKADKQDRIDAQLDSLAA